MPVTFKGNEILQLVNELVSIPSPLAILTRLLPM